MLLGKINALILTEESKRHFKTFSGKKKQKQKPHLSYLAQLLREQYPKVSFPISLRTQRQQLERGVRAP